ncbi:hypothetical protein DPMN_059345 [Dreissena polymorpha]|uniref:Uncharacterized protein n=1 Tax=Dreissena polymorpha TaxID=45954 RepID=A0A9D4C3T5_DREPO|nr:hypothetical protein DPMN_059345 [Dreissena polymorpha]
MIIALKLTADATTRISKMTLKAKQILIHSTTSSVSSCRTSCNPPDSVPDVRLYFLGQLTAIITVLHRLHTTIGVTFRSANCVIIASSLRTSKQMVSSVWHLEKTCATRKLAQSEDIRLVKQNLVSPLVFQRASGIALVKSTST